MMEITMRTNNPAEDWDEYDARTRMQRKKYASEHHCCECEYYQTPPSGTVAWCKWWDDYVDGTLLLNECDYWEE